MESFKRVRRKTSDIHSNFWVIQNIFIFGVVKNTSCSFTNFLSENTGKLKLIYFGCKFKQEKIAKKINFSGNVY